MQVIPFLNYNPLFEPNRLNEKTFQGISLKRFNIVFTELWLGQVHCFQNRNNLCFG